MLNKNLFILLFSFVVIGSFAADKTKNKQRPIDAGIVEAPVKDLDKNLPKDSVQDSENKVLTEKPAAIKENDELIEKAGKEWELVENSQKIVKNKLSAEKEAKIKNPELFLIDKIDTVIYGPEETSIIAKSDLDKMGLDGQKRTKDKMIFELQVYQDAKKYNLMDEKLVDKYIEAIQTQQNLSLNDIKKMFYEFGYTYEEGREQLAMYNIINQLMDYKVRSKVIIPEKEVRAYYDANPVYLEEAYNLQRIFVPFESQADLDEERINIESKIKNGEAMPYADYSEYFWVEKPELADDKKFISSMLPNSISEPVLIEGGFELFKLIDRRERQLASFDQRYREITDLLREPLYDKLFDEYKESLIKDSVVVELE
ncbi:MAG: PPIC-type PPIASE domain protein [candidate division TM6 bacterium GW2011_GWF2_30_66]|jgi:parvulin-like peptidyl-prolyl isomerase|nr:MAG: PPIC-type PPIASE domain protein [candidate division TM6 bacterium GW2011_GWF2_30_66]